MAGTKVVKLWAAIVAAFAALLAALGFAPAPAAAVRVQQTEAACNRTAGPAATAAAPASWTVPAPRKPPCDGALPPTMKQRIRAEAHGASPRCRRQSALAWDADPLGATTG